MDFDLSFAGVPFRIFDAATLDRISARYPFETPTDGTMQEAGPPWSPDPDKQPLPLKPGGLVVRVGEFFYPTNASRFGVFRGLAHTDDVTAMMAATAAGQNAGTFVMNSGDDDRPISTMLYMLPAQPVAGELLGSADWWLVTLVDERFWWRNTSIDTTSFDFFGTYVSNDAWDRYLDLFRAQLGITIDLPPIFPLDSLGLRPPHDSPLNTTSDRASQILDLAAASNGWTVVRRFDGTYKMAYMRFARDAAVAIRKTAAGDLRSGGSAVTGDISGSASSFYSAEKTAMLVPSAFRGRFPKQKSTPTKHYPYSHENGYTKDYDFMGGEYAVTKTFADLTAYSGRFTYPDTNGQTLDLWCSWPARYTAPYAPTYVDHDPGAYVVMFAAWYVDSVTYHLDEWYNGVDAFDVEAAVDYTVRWTADDCATHIVRYHNDWELRWFWQDLINQKQRVPEYFTVKLAAGSGGGPGTVAYGRVQHWDNATGTYSDEPGAPVVSLVHPNGRIPVFPVSGNLLYRSSYLGQDYNGNEAYEIDSLLTVGVVAFGTLGIGAAGISTTTDTTKLNFSYGFLGGGSAGSQEIRVTPASQSTPGIITTFTGLPGATPWGGGYPSEYTPDFQWLGTSPKGVDSLWTTNGIVFGPSSIVGTDGTNASLSAYNSSTTAGAVGAAAMTGNGTSFSIAVNGYSGGSYVPGGAHNFLSFNSASGGSSVLALGGTMGGSAIDWLDKITLHAEEIWCEQAFGTKLKVYAQLGVYSQSINSATDAHAMLMVGGTAGDTWLNAYPGAGPASAQLHISNTFGAVGVTIRNLWVNGIHPKATANGTSPYTGQDVDVTVGGSPQASFRDGVLVGPLFGSGGIPVGSGGTGATSFPAGEFLLGNGTSPITSTSTIRVGPVTAEAEIRTAAGSWIHFDSDNF